MSDFRAIKKKNECTNKRLLAATFVTVALSFGYSKDNFVNAAEYQSLKQAINDTVSPRSYTLYDDENVTDNLGTMKGNTGAELTIYGNSNYSVFGNEKIGLTVNSGKVLNAENVGSLNSDGTVKAAWQGFSGQLFKNDKGTINFKGQNVIANNSGTGSTVLMANNNGSTFNVTGNLSFIDNSYASSLLSNSDSVISNINLTITGNKEISSTGIVNGLINNYANTDKSASIGVISGSFNNNVISSTANGIYGSILHNNAKGTAQIDGITAEIGNNEISSNGSLYGALIRNDSNGGVAKIGDMSSYIHDNTISSNGAAYGIILSNKGNIANAEFGNITGKIEKNKFTFVGSVDLVGLISNEGNGGGKATIAGVSGQISDNEIVTTRRTLKGGLIYNYAKTAASEIGNISSMLTSNAVNVFSTLGGLIFNGSDSSTDSVMGIISGEIKDNNITIGNGSVDGGVLYNMSSSSGKSEVKGLSSEITANNISSNGTVNGGIIYNTGKNSIIDYISGNITKNTIIANEKIAGGVINNQAKIDSVSGDIKENYVESKNNAVDGGILFNDTNSTGIVTSAIENNYTKSLDIENSNGGIIYNLGTLTLTDNSVKNNATNLKSAILNSGTLNIIANEKDVLFTGNKINATVTRDEATGIVSAAGGEYSDIVNSNSGTVNLSANSGKTITFNGAIESNGGNNTVKINNSDIKGGTYVFNNVVSANSVALYNGAELKLGSYGQEDNSKSYGRLATANFSNDSKGGAIDFQNNHIDEHSFGNLTLNSDLNFKFDADLASGTSDMFSADSVSGSGKLNIIGIDILSDSQTKVSTKISNDVLKNAIKLSVQNVQNGNYSYALLYDSSRDDGGYLTFDSTAAHNLVTVSRSNEAQRIYNMNANESIAADIASIGDSSTSIGVIGAGILIVDGNAEQKYGITGNGKGGFIVNSDSNLTLKNIGDATVNTDTGEYTYKRGIEGFTKVQNSGGSVVYNEGELSIEDVVFYKNNAGNQYGSVVYNNNGKITKITGKFINNSKGTGAIYNYGSNGIIDYIEADFIGNSTENHGGVITNNHGGTISEIVGSHFVLNTAKKSGGAIRNLEGTGNYAKIDNSLFKYNTARQGGAINNGKNSTLIVNNTLFDENFSVKSLSSGVSGGSAIYNEGNIEITDSAFKNNASDSEGGAIYSNIGNIEIFAKSDDVLFTNNKANAVLTKGNNGIYSTEGGEYNDFYGNGKTEISLSANAGKNITFNGSLVGSNTTLSINADENIKGGTYNFNNNVNLKNMSVNNGAYVKLGSYQQEDNTTTYGTLSLSDFSNDTNGGTIDMANSAKQAMVLGKTSLQSALDLELDIWASDKMSDTIQVADGSNGTFNLSNINWVDGDDKYFDGKITIINNANANTILTLADDITAQDTVQGGLELSNSVKWDDNIGSYVDINSYKLVIAGSDSSNTLKDSIMFELTGTERTYDTEGDTLALINQADVETYGEGFDNREFKFDSAGNVYKAKENAGVTGAGTLTIKGVADGDNRSTIDADGKKLFEITGENPSTVKINNTKIMNALLVATVAKDNTLTLDNSVIDTSNTQGIANNGTLNVISSEINKDITGTGTTNYSGTNVNTVVVTQEKVTNTGTLTNRGTIDSILENSSNIDNYSVINEIVQTSGLLNNYDDGEITKLTLNTGSDSSVNNSGSISSAIISTGSIANSAGGTISSLTMSGGSVDNLGNITTATVNSGELENKGTTGEIETLSQSGGTVKNSNAITNVNVTGGNLTNNSNGVIENFVIDGGTASNSGIVNNLENSGTFTNNSDGTIGNVINESILKNFGSINGTLNNSGTISENGTITTSEGINSGTINQSYLTSTGTFSNTGTITASANISHSGTDFTNDGTIQTQGFTNSGTFTNNEGKTLTATGTAANSGTLTTNAGDFKTSSGLNNTGTLNFTGGITQNVITGNGTTHIQGNVTLAHAIENTVSLDTTASNTAGIASMGVNSVSGLITNGGNLNLQYQSGTENYSLGNVILSENAGLAIDVDLRGSSEVKKADNISATSVSGNETIYINNLNITVPADGDEAPTYAQVTGDNNLKTHMDLGDNTKTHVDSLSEKGFMITYTQDSAGENTGGFLEFSYIDLTTAARATTNTRVYVMGSSDENIPNQLSEYGGEGINDDTHAFGGKALSVNGNGTQSILGGASEDEFVGGFEIGNNQTLSLNNIKEVTGFTTGVKNNGTLNITDVTFTGNTTDIDNNGTLNLYGNDVIDTVTNSGSEKGKTVVKAYSTTDGAGNAITVFADAVINKSITQDEIEVQKDNKLTIKGTSDSKLNNAGTVDNQGAMIVNGGSNTGTISSSNNNGTVEFKGDYNNSGSIEGKTVTVTSGTLTNDKTETSTGSIVSEIINNSTINNKGEITAKGGSNNSVINGDGTLTIDDEFANNSEGKISQGSVIVNESKKLTNAGEITSNLDIKDGATVENSNKITANGGTNKGSVSSTGENSELVIADDFTNNGSINENKITVNDGKKLTNTGDNANIAVNTLSAGANSTVENEKTLTVNKSVDNNGTISNTKAGAELNLKGEDMTVGGTITNVKDADVNIEGTGTTTLASDFTNNGNLNIKSDTEITKAIEGTGSTVNTADNLSVKAAIEQTAFTNENGTVTVADGSGIISTTENIVNKGTLISNAENLYVGEDKEIQNSGTLKLTGGDNKNTITGNDGTTEFSGTTTNKADITQKDVNIAGSGDVINDGSATITANLTNDGKFDNKGTVKGNTENNGTFNNNGTSDGTVNNNGTYVNNGTITGDITNDENGDFTNNSSITSNVDNKGNLKNTDNATISGDINNSKNITNSGNITGKLTNTGTVDNTGKISGTTLNQTTSNPQTGEIIPGVINTTIAGLTGDITNNAIINYTDGGSTVADIKGDGTINLNGSGTVTLNNNINGNTLSLNNGTLIFGSNKDISQGGFIGNGGTIGGVIDGQLTEYLLGDVNLKQDTKISGIDFNLKNLKSDKFTGNYSGDGVFDIGTVQVKGIPAKNSIRVKLADTTNIPENNLRVKNQKLPDIMTSIRKMSGKIQDNTLIYQGASNNYADFNPSVMASSVATQGGYLNQLEALLDGFYHMERYTKYTHKQRYTAENSGKYASSDNTYVPSSNPELPLTSEAMWTKPYATFENIQMKNGPVVDNFAYGAFYGGDSDLKDLGSGWKGIISAFVGYNGNHMSYDNISINMAGGTLGATGTLYKGNFFTGMTISAGGSSAEASTYYGDDHFQMITAGIANKTGYNWEINGGKLIIQPSLFTGYVMVNTFDYTNSANVRINSDPLHAIQIVPGLKIIGNLENGWQPYAAVDMVWNLIDNNKVMANDAQLPRLSVKPFVEYGVGVQKSWGERFTAYFQTMLRNGGRNGVALTAGFRWTLGKSKHAKINKQIKPVSAKSSEVGTAAEAPELQLNTVNNTNIDTLPKTTTVKLQKVKNSKKQKIKGILSKIDGDNYSYTIEITPDNQKRTVIKSR